MFLVSFASKYLPLMSFLIVIFTNICPTNFNDILIVALLARSSNFIITTLLRH